MGTSLRATDGLLPTDDGPAADARGRPGLTRRRAVIAGGALGALAVTGGVGGVAYAARAPEGALRRSAWEPLVGRAIPATANGRPLQLRLDAVEDLGEPGTAVRRGLEGREDSFALRFVATRAPDGDRVLLRLPQEAPVELLLVDHGRAARGRGHVLRATVLGAPPAALEGA